MATIRRTATRPRVRLPCALMVAVPAIASQASRVLALRWVRHSIISPTAYTSQANCRTTPANLVHWIERPHDIHPDTVMPNTDLPDQDAHDIAAYLYTLR